MSLSRKTLLLSVTLAGSVLSAGAAWAQPCPVAAALPAAGATGETPAPCPVADEVSLRRARAQELYEAQRYREALVELQAAYAVRQEAQLLFEHGRVFARLGQIAEALDAYSRYLAAEPNAPAEMRREATAEISRLSAWLMPPAAVTGSSQRPQLPGLRLPLGAGAAGERVAAVRFEQRPYGGLIAGGIALMSVGYTPAIICGPLFGSLVFGSSRSTSLQSAVGWTLAIPVAGPFLSGLLSLGDSRYFGSTWAAAWIFADGVAQVAGLAMVIAGARNKQKVPVFAEHLRVLPYSQPGGGGLAMMGRF